MRAYALAAFKRLALRNYIILRICMCTLDTCATLLYTFRFSPVLSTVEECVANYSSSPPTKENAIHVVTNDRTSAIFQLGASGAAISLVL